MRAAAKHLASVTLELGGKSPTIVDETASISNAVKQLTFGKFSNNGQICIAPDYVFVHEKVKDKFIDAMKKSIESFYGKDPSTSEDYMRVINNRHFQRINSYLENSVAAGAKVVHGGKTNSSVNYIEPTLVVDTPMDSDLMQKEIFGPIMPIFTFNDLQEPLDLINSKEKPLALYIFSKSRKNIKRILKNTTAGGTCINNNLVHFFNDNLPFGGVNNSGIGKSHGKWGFQEFSNARGVYKQNIPGAMEFLLPPYNDLKRKLIDLTIKWF